MSTNTQRTLASLVGSSHGRAGPGRPAPTRALARLKVLLVEAHADTREMTKLFLELHGHSCEAVSDAEGALTVIGLWAPDVVLLDTWLPGTDGYDLARRIRERAGPGIRLIAATGRAEAAEAAKAGFDAAALKPIDLDALLELLVAPHGDAER